MLLGLPYQPRNVFTCFITEVMLLFRIQCHIIFIFLMILSYYCFDYSRNLSLSLVFLHSAGSPVFIIYALYQIRMYVPFLTSCPTLIVNLNGLFGAIFYCFLNINWVFFLIYKMSKPHYHVSELEPPIVRKISVSVLSHLSLSAFKILPQIYQNLDTFFLDCTSYYNLFYNKVF